jgi:peptidoglycan LD-endopeptidase CwlK
MATLVLAPRSLQPPVDHSEACLAPLFDAAIDAAVSECNVRGDDAMVWETCRSQALQQWYYDHGASHAQNILRSWHGYGLAVDVISRRHGWDLWGPQNTDWQQRVSGVFKAHGLSWGGDWKSFKDWPHFQWGKCKPTPSDNAIVLFVEGTALAVWNAVGATR